MNLNTLTVLAGLLAATTGGIVAEQVTDSTDAGQEQAAAAVTGCAIRFPSTGKPAILDDADHRCTGATSVSVLTNGDLQLRHPKPGPIVSVTADEDETLTGRGIVAGASGRGTVTIVRFYSTKTGKVVPASSTLLKGSTSNIWLTWVH